MIFCTLRLKEEIRRRNGPGKCEPFSAYFVFRSAFFFVCLEGILWGQAGGWGVVLLVRVLRDLRVGVLVFWGGNRTLMEESWWRFWNDSALLPFSIGGSCDSVSSEKNNYDRGEGFHKTLLVHRKCSAGLLSPRAPTISSFWH